MTGEATDSAHPPPDDHVVPAGTVCLQCDYDLRGMPAGGRCPECGLDISTVYQPRGRFALGDAWHLPQRDQLLAVAFAAVSVTGTLTAFAGGLYLLLAHADLNKAFGKYGTINVTACGLIATALLCRLVAGALLVRLVGNQLPRRSPEAIFEILTVVGVFFVFIETALLPNKSPLPLAMIGCLLLAAGSWRIPRYWDRFGRLSLAIERARALRADGRWQGRFLTDIADKESRQFGTLKHAQDGILWVCLFIILAAAGGSRSTWWCILFIPLFVLMIALLATCLMAVVLQLSMLISGLRLKLAHN